MIGWIYHSVYDSFGGNEFNTYVFGGTAVTALFFWLFNSFFIFLALFKPRWAQKYKIQKNKSVTLNQYLRPLKAILFNQWFVAPAITSIWYFAAKARNCPFTGPLPTYTEYILHFAICIIIEEIGFYYSHRLFHVPVFYKAFHKQHHEWQAPVSITSIYCHPVEHAISNLTPIMLGPVLCGSHVSFLWFWAIFALFSTTCSHSGYHFPFMLPAEHHDHHHQHGDENFGLGLGLDRLHNTDRRFRASVGARRSYITTSLTPVEEQVPE